MNSSPWISKSDRKKCIITKYILSSFIFHLCLNISQYVHWDTCWAYKMLFAEACKDCHNWTIFNLKKKLNSFKFSIPTKCVHFVTFLHFSEEVLLSFASDWTRPGCSEMFTCMLLLYLRLTSTSSLLPCWVVVHVISQFTKHKQFM